MILRQAALFLSIVCSFLLSAASISASTLDIDKKAEAFGKRPFTKAMTISPDGKHFALIFEQGEKQSLRIVNAQTGKVTKDVNFDDSWRFGNLYWANAERVLVQPYYQPGLTNTIVATGAIYGVNVNGAKERFLLGPNAGAQTGSMAGKSTKRIAGLVIDTFDSNRRKVVVQVFDNSGQRPSTALLDIYNGRLSKRSYGPSGVRFCQFSIDREAQARYCRTVNTDTDHAQLYYRPAEAKDWQLVYEGQKWDEEFTIHGQLKSGNFLASFPHPETSVTALYEISVIEGKLNKTLIHSDPVFDPISVYGSSFRGLTRVLYANPKPSYVYLGEDPVIEDVHRGLAATFPDEYVSFTSITADNKLALVRISSDQAPRRHYLLDVASRKMQLVDDSYADVKALTSPMNTVEITARDGQVLRGHLSLTHHEQAKGLVMVIHGGPHGPFDTWGYSSEIQFLTSLGLNVLQVNFRGSGGFGLDFMRQGYGEWGRKMQDDVTDATRWAVASGIAPADKICIYGGSYGAYAALAGAAFEPDLYQCAAGHVGVYDLQELRRSGDIPERKSGVRFLNRVIGNDQEDLKSRSPTAFANDIKIPVLLTAGLDDERAPPIQTRLMESALADAGKKVTVSYQSREGHGFISETAEISRLAQLGRFILSALGAEQ